MSDQNWQLKEGDQFAPAVPGSLENLPSHHCAPLLDIDTRFAAAHYGHDFKQGHPPAQPDTAGCTRSHPHGLMSEECQRKTDVARLENKLAQQPDTEALQARIEELERINIIERADASYWRARYTKIVVPANPEPDDINHPAHYASGKVECIDAIEAALTPEEYRGYLKGNIIKYTWRERTKEGDKAMGKARWYLNRMLDGAK